MPREKEDFRPNLQQLNERFPDKEHFTLKEMAAYLGMDPRTVKKRYRVDKQGVTKVQFARLIS